MGVGGGIILVPLLVSVLNMSQHEAQGTSLAYILPTALVAAIPYYTHERLDLVLVSFLAHRTSAPTLSRLFAMFLLGVAVQMILRPPRDRVARSTETEEGIS